MFYFTCNHLWAGLVVNHCSVVASLRSMTSFSREPRKRCDWLQWRWLMNIWQQARDR